MILRDLTLSELETLHRTELTEAFPPEERKPFAAMKALYEAGVYHPVGAFEGEKGDALVGYALLWESPGYPYVLIDYLGVTASRRNGGLGAKILTLLREKFAHLDGIIVESEAPEGGESDSIRRRRMNFYRRCGYTFLSYECILFGVVYAVCLMSPNGKGTEAGALAAHQALYAAQFSPEAYERFVEIPRDPNRPKGKRLTWADQTTLPGKEKEERE